MSEPERTQVHYKNVRGWHVIWLPENPKVVVTARQWNVAAARAEEVLGVEIAESPQAA
jgi:hypothetical protein